MRWSAIAGLIALLLAGCAAYQPKPLEPSRTATAFESRTLDNLGLKRFVEANLKREVAPWPPQSWDFQLLTLVAFYYHPDLDAARAGLGVAEAGELTAESRPNPSAGFIPQYDFNPAAGVSPWTLGFTFELPIETAGKRGYRLAQATRLTKAARLDLAAAAWQVRSRLREALLDLEAAREAHILLQRQESIQTELVSLLLQRLAAGEAARPELTQAEIAEAQTALLLADSRKQQAESQVRLAGALGLPVKATRGLTLAADLLAGRLPAPPLREVRRKALRNRTDLLAILAQYEAAQAALQLEIARQYPDMQLGPGYQWDQGENKWFLGFSATLPIFNQNQGPIAEAEARRKAAAARFTAQQAAVIGEIDQNVAGYHAALAKLETAEKLLASERQRQESAETLFRAGETDRLTLLSARLELAANALARQRALAAAKQSLGLLEDALQYPLFAAGPIPADLAADPRSKQEVSSE